MNQIIQLMGILNTTSDSSQDELKIAYNCVIHINRFLGFYDTHSILQKEFDIEDFHTQISIPSNK